MPWTPGVTTGADMATDFNALDSDFDALLAGFSESVDDRVAALLAAGANITLTYDDVTGTLTIAAAGGGAPGGSSGQVQFNNAGAFGGATDVEIEGGQLRLDAIATPTAPAAGGVKLFGRDVGGRLMPAFVGPSGLDSALQPSFGRNAIAFVRPRGNSTTLDQIGFTSTATGTATAGNVAQTTIHTELKRIVYAVTASTTAVVGWRSAANQFSVGGAGAGRGGFHLIMRWGPATGVSTATHRAFAGMRVNAAPTDVEPSSLTSIVGMGWDAADTNVQFMHNDGSGTATKIDLGASFPVPSVDATDAYEVALFAQPGTTQSLGYTVTNLTNGAVASGTVTSDLPSTSTLLAPAMYMSVGGTSSVIGIAVMNVYIETDI